MTRGPVPRREPAAPRVRRLPPASAALARRAQAGDRQAFAELYRDCAPPVQALLLASLPASLVDDVHQEVFLAVWEGLPAYDPARPLLPWVYGIARNLVRRAWRRRRPEIGAAALDELPAEAPAVDARLMQAERSARVLAELRRLPAAERELLALRLLEGWLPSEIAAAWQTSAASVRVQVHRALRHLRARLPEEDLR